MVDVGHASAHDFIEASARLVDGPVEVVGEAKDPHMHKTWDLAAPRPCEQVEP